MRSIGGNRCLTKVAVQCSAGTFVVKIATFAKPQNVLKNLYGITARIPHFTKILLKECISKIFSDFEEVSKLCSGAQGGTRTRTLIKARDFKSLVSTIPPPGQCKEYTLITFIIKGSCGIIV